MQVYIPAVRPHVGIEPVIGLLAGKVEVPNGILVHELSRLLFEPYALRYLVLAVVSLDEVKVISLGCNTVEAVGIGSVESTLSVKPNMIRGILYVMDGLVHLDCAEALVHIAAGGGCEHVDISLVYAAPNCYRHHPWGTPKPQGWTLSGKPSDSSAVYMVCVAMRQQNQP